MHYRGCSGSPNLKPISYHSGYTDDVIDLVRMLTKRFPKAPIAAVGYSLGGNLLLKWLGETQDNNPLATAIAVSVPFQLKTAADVMLSGLSRFYQWYILNGVHKQILMKFDNKFCPVDLTLIKHQKTFWEFDHYYTAPIHGFRSAIDYYQQSSCRQYLSNITVPTLIIHAKDDPFMSEEVIPTMNELSNSTTLEISDHGGHVGFIYGKIPGKPKFWLDQRIISRLAEHFELNPSVCVKNEHRLAFSSLHSQK